MGEKFSIYITNAQCRMEKGKRILLTHDQANMLPCTVIESEDGCTFVFDMDGMTKFRSIVDLTKMEQYQLLANCADLEKYAARYFFRLTPDNLVYDRNLCPYILMRDRKEEDKEFFFEEYKALVAAVLSEKYRFIDFYEGGNDLYKKIPSLRELEQKNSTREIFQYLLTNFKREKREEKTQRMSIKKSRVLAVKIIVPILVFTVFGLAVYAFLFQGKKMRFQEKIIQAYSYYLHADYVRVGDELKEIPIEQLSEEMQYVLARSHIFSEGLTPKQRESVLSGIGLNTDKTALRYWIEIGRGDFASAVDTAKRLGDDELLLFAYIKQSAYVAEDAAMSGEEKVKIRESLESDIKNMSESIANEKKTVLETVESSGTVGE